jgi:phosphoserine phosphatase RsbU/P
VTDNRRLAAPPDRRRAPRGGRRDSDRPGRHPVILVADHYEDARAPVARYLDRYGFEVLEAASAAEATDLVARRRPQVILSGLNGAAALDFYESLSASGSPSPIVILLTSGVDDPIPRQATSVMEKPFSLRPMLDELRRGLRAVEARALGGV